MIEIITCILFIIGSTYLAQAALRKYVAHNLNYENVLYWGLSFLMIGLSAALHLICCLEINPLMNPLLQETTILLENMAIWLNLYAMAYVANACPYYGTKKCIHHKVCRRKLVRISVWAVMIISILVITMGKIAASPVLMSYIYQLLMVMVIVWMLFGYRKFGIHLYVAYIVYALSEVMMIANYLVNSLPMYQLSMGLQAATIIIMLSEVTKLINREED